MNSLLNKNIQLLKSTMLSFVIFGGAIFLSACGSNTDQAIYDPNASCLTTAVRPGDQAAFILENFDENSTVLIRDVPIDSKDVTVKENGVVLVKIPSRLIAGQAAIQIGSGADLKSVCSLSVLKVSNSNAPSTSNPECYGDYDCPGDLVCNSQNKCVVSNDTYECEEDDDCDDGYSCHAGSCVVSSDDYETPECVDNTDCESNEECNSGKCELIDNTDLGQDTDGDGFEDILDSCPQTANSGQEDDVDGDGLGDACDTTDNSVHETDGDGIKDTDDNCPLVDNSDQNDFDNDGMGDVCDGDDDNDGLSDNSEDPCLLDHSNTCNTGDDLPPAPAYNEFGFASVENVSEYPGVVAITWYGPADYIYGPFNRKPSDGGKLQGSDKKTSPCGLMDDRYLAVTEEGSKIEPQSANGTKYAAYLTGSQCKGNNCLEPLNTTAGTPATPSVTPQPAVNPGSGIQIKKLKAPLCRINLDESIPYKTFYTRIYDKSARFVIVGKNENGKEVAKPITIKAPEATIDENSIVVTMSQIKPEITVSFGYKNAYEAPSITTKSSGIADMTYKESSISGSYSKIIAFRPDMEITMKVRGLGGQKSEVKRYISCSDPTITLNPLDGYYAQQSGGESTHSPHLIGFKPLEANVYRTCAVVKTKYTPPAPGSGVKPPSLGNASSSTIVPWVKTIKFSPLNSDKAYSSQFQSYTQSSKEFKPLNGKASIKTRMYRDYEFTQFQATVEDYDGTTKYSNIVNVPYSGAYFETYSYNSLCDGVQHFDEDDHTSNIGWDLDGLTYTITFSGRHIDHIETSCPGGSFIQSAPHGPGDPDSYLDHLMGTGWTFTGSIGISNNSNVENTGAFPINCFFKAYDHSNVLVANIPIAKSNQCQGTWGDVDGDNYKLPIGKGK